MFAFDLLYFDGHDIRSLELTARRYFLRQRLGAGTSIVVIGRGTRFGVFADRIRIID